MGNCTSGTAGANARILKQQKQHVPETIGSLFESYAGEKIFLSVQDIQQFLIDQRINNSEATARQLIVKHKKEAAANGGSSTNGDTSLELDLPGFASLLLDTDVNALHDDSKVTHNMNQPLPQYFIQTGHKGFQGVGSSVAEVITDALRDGARVIHLEVRPDGDQNFRLLSGGMTAPSNETFAAIKEGAFTSSEFPVILVIESNVLPQVEDLLAQHLKAALGESLFVPRSGPRGSILSPNELKRKFVIADVAPDGPPAAPAATPTSVLPTTNAGPAKQGAFSSLVYFRAISASEPTDFADKVGTIANLTEAAFNRLADTSPSVLAKYVADNLVRISAPGDKADPTGPLKAWAYGAQIVPVDAQANARHLWLQQGFFSANGSCGYVKKPDLLRASTAAAGSDGAAFDPKSTLPVKTTLKVMVLWSQTGKGAGRPDTFVRIASYGVPADQEIYDTATCPGGGKPAAWETQEFHFPLTVPELALLAIEVREFDFQHQEVLACQAYLPVAELCPGLRAIAMKDATGTALPGAQDRLLIHVELSPAESTGPLPSGSAASAPPLAGGVPVGAPGPGGPQGVPGGPQYGPGGVPQYAQPPSPQQVVHTRYQETIVHERRRSPVVPFLGGMLVGRMLAPRPRQQVVVVNNKAPPASNRVVKNNTVNINKGPQYKAPGYSKPAGASYARPAAAASGYGRPGAGAVAAAGNYARPAAASYGKPAAGVRASAGSYGKPAARAGGGGRIRRRR